ncbi:MAG: glycoside hydrolase family 5 protein [Candidatus Coatesbacteria bacterium]
MTLPSRLRAAAILAGLTGSLVMISRGAGAAPASETPAMVFVRRMGLGWNLGNTLEACGDWIKGGRVRDYETAWGNPVTTRELVHAIREAGFGSVRIPVAWSNLMGENFTIDTRLLERVGRVVDDVLDEGMVAVVNIHWDGGWWEHFQTDEPGTMRRYTRMWSQIAGHCRDRSTNLVFESLNEEGNFPKLWDPYKPGQAEGKRQAYAILNRINQAFVDLTRTSGGMNGVRPLLIAGHSTDIDRTTDPEFRMPTDPAKMSIVSVHYYTPSTFAILEKDASWGKARSTWGTREDLKELDDNFKKLHERFLTQGIPVIVGEYGGAAKNKDPVSVRTYNLTIAGRALRLGMCPMLWDAGGYFNRKILRFNDPELADGFRKLAAPDRTP